jgi:hypothetical protein
LSRNFPNWLVAYHKYTKHSESPDLFHLWTGVSTIGGALRRQVWIDQRFFEWTPNFYIVLVGPPGVAAKSTSANIGMDLLHKVEAVHFGPKSMTWQGLITALTTASELVPYGKGMDMVYEPMACITCVVSELGTFLRPKDKEMVDVLVDLWDGRKETWRRSLATSEGYEVENPWINVIGATTPSWLEENFDESMIGGGLVSRIVFVYGDEKKMLIPYPAEVQDKEEHEAMAKLLVEDLQQIALIKGEYIITPEAIEWGSKWYAKHWRARPDHMASERYSGYIARKQTHMHKLAIVLAAAQRDELTITKADLIQANKFVTDLEESMEKVFTSIGVSETSKWSKEIISYLRTYTEMRQSVLYRHLMTSMTVKQFDETVAAMVKANLLRVIARGTGIVYRLVSDDDPPESIDPEEPPPLTEP